MRNMMDLFWIVAFFSVKSHFAGPTERRSWQWNPVCNSSSRSLSKRRRQAGTGTRTGTETVYLELLHIQQGRDQHRLCDHYHFDCHYRFCREMHTQHSVYRRFIKCQLSPTPTSSRCWGRTFWKHNRCGQSDAVSIKMFDLFLVIVFERYCSAG